MGEKCATNSGTAKRLHFENYICAHVLKKTRFTYRRNSFGIHRDKNENLWFRVLFFCDSICVQMHILKTHQKFVYFKRQNLKKCYCKIESLTINNNMYISKNCTDRSQNDTFVRNNYTCETFRWFDRLFESSNNLFRPKTSLWVWNSDSVFNNEHWNPPTKHYNVVRIIPIPFVHVDYRWINIWVWCELM